MSSYAVSILVSEQTAGQMVQEAVTLYEINALVEKITSCSYVEKCFFRVGVPPSRMPLFSIKRESIPPSMPEYPTVLLFTQVQHCLKSDKESHRELATQRIKVCPSFIKYLPKEMKEDPDIAMWAVFSDSSTKASLPKKLLGKIDWLKKMLLSELKLKSGACILDPWPHHKAFLSDYHVMLELVRLDIGAMKQISPRLLCNKKFIKEAFSINWKSLKYADKSVRNHPENAPLKDQERRKIIECLNDLLDVQIFDPWPYHEEYLSDPEIILLTLPHPTSALSVANPPLRQDPEFMLKAIRIDQYACAYLDPSLKRNKEYMLNLIVENDYAYGYADQELKKDPSFIREATRQNPKAQRHIPFELKQHCFK